MVPLKDQLTNTEKIKLEIFLERMNASSFPWTVLYWELRCHIILSKAKRRIRREKSTKSNTYSNNCNVEKRIKNGNSDLQPTNFLELEALEDILRKARNLIEEGEKILAEKNRITTEHRCNKEEGTS